MQPISTVYFLSFVLSIILGGAYFYLWRKVPKCRAYLYFSLAVFALAIYAGIEYRMLLAPTTAEFTGLLRVVHVPAFLLLTFLALFIKEYLDSPRSWILWAFVGVRMLALLLNFLSPQNLNFNQVTELRPYVILGETLNAPIGQANPFVAVGQLSLILFLAFCIDATVHAMRNGQARKGLIVGGGAIILIVGATANTALVFSGTLIMPLLTSPFFMGIFVAMLFELTRTAADSLQLASTLERRDQELVSNSRRSQLVEEAGHAGVWMRDFRTGEMWVSDAWCRVFEFDDPDAVDFDKFLSRIHNDDRAAFVANVEAITRGASEYHYEYRILPPSGEMKWISSRGRVDRGETGEAVVIYGASVDVTPQKLAEEAAHEMSGRLIHAQEMERARIARELHDDLSQSLALISIRLEMLSGRPATGSDFQEVVDTLSANLRTLSSDVHRLSHELHPAKLEQLGLAPAIRGFCREISEGRGLQVEFNPPDLPRDLPSDIALCLYRVTQEALQNVAKHSGASSAKVSLELANGEIRLAISDDGSGFDAAAPALKESLGLIGMGERVRSVRGTFHVESAPGKGTCITATAPLPHTLEAEPLRAANSAV